MHMTVYKFPYKCQEICDKMEHLNRDAPKTKCFKAASFPLCPAHRTALHSNAFFKESQPTLLCTLPILLFSVSLHRTDTM